MRILRRNASYIFVCISVLVFVLILSLTIHLSPTIIPGTTRPQHSLQLDTLLETRWRAYTVTHPGWDAASISVYIVFPGKGTFFSSTNKSSDENTHFRGASTVKMFTASAIMLLNQTGKLNIEDRITNYLPNTSAYAIPYKESITIRQLLEHRAGVFDILNQLLVDGTSYVEEVLSEDPTHQFTTEEILGVLARGNYSNFAPGTTFRYSDTGYTLLGKIVERVNGLRYDQFVSEHFLRPNGLTQTSLPWLGTDRRLPYPYMLGHLRVNGTFIVEDEFNLSGRVAEGNIITTLRDLATFLIRLFNGETELSSETVKEMIRTKPAGGPNGGEEVANDAYGLGIAFLRGLGYGHTGSIDGYATYAFYDPWIRVS